MESKPCTYTDNPLESSPETQKHMVMLNYASASKQCTGPEVGRNYYFTVYPFHHVGTLVRIEPTELVITNASRIINSGLWMECSQTGRIINSGLWMECSQTGELIEEIEPCMNADGSPATVILPRLVTTAQEISWPLPTTRK